MVFVLAEGDETDARVVAPAGDGDGALSTEIVGGALVGGDGGSVLQSTIKICAVEVVEGRKREEHAIFPSVCPSQVQEAVALALLVTHIQSLLPGCVGNLVVVAATGADNA